jgi:hypothetical protein
MWTHFVEHQVAYDHVGRPLARCRGAIEAVGLDPFDERRKDDEALSERRKLPLPVFGHGHLPRG